MTTLRISFSVIIFSLQIGGCKPRLSSTSKTDLGVGNALVIDSFKKYRAKALHCEAQGQGKRVLVTGFGLYDNSVNISGVISSALAHPEFTATELLQAGPGTAMALSDLPQGAGSISDDDHGAVARTRILSIRNQKYQVCTLVMDIRWDLAAAIILHEATVFKADMIIMMGRLGRNEAIWESTAANQVVGAAGVNAQGKRLEQQNKPVGKTILESAPQSFRMTWDNSKLAAATSQQIKKLGFASSAAKDWRPSNNFICNNVSYVALAAAHGLPIILAKDFKVAAAIPMQTKIGFLHLPYDSALTAKSIRSWIDIIATAIDVSLRGT